MKSTELDNYHQKLRLLFQEYDVAKGIIDFKVDLIIRKNPLEFMPANFRMIEKDGHFLYLLNFKQV
jgi:hypothetical protein